MTLVLTICRRGSALAALLVCAGLLTGCAAPGGPAGTMVHEQVDQLACGITVKPGAALFGEEVLISRAATPTGDAARGESGPGECGTLVPGSTQTLELRSSVLGVTAEARVTAVVDAHGGFEARMRIPTGIRLGDAIVTAIPPAEFGCPAVTAETTAECILPRTYFRVGFDPEDLEPVTITSTDEPTPRLPVETSLNTSYALAGPGPTDLTLVIWGSGCAARPSSFVGTAAADSLEIVSADVVPHEQDCAAMAELWTTVMEIPEGFGDYRTVSVDNVDAILLGRPGEVFPDSMAPVEILGVTAEAPPLPDGTAWDSSAQPGPGRNELTLTIVGSSCATRPSMYVVNAPSDRLHIVSAETVPAGEGCDSVATPWTTVISVPEKYRDYRTVSVDNVDAVLLER
jgi:hypothetical protein